MKKIIYMLFAFAVIAVNVNAQQSDAERLKTFVKELMSLSNEHIQHEKQGLESGDVDSSVNQYLVLKTLDDLGYEAVYEILNKYEVLDSEELFGIPMAINTIDGERQVAVFMDEKNSIFVADWYKGCTVLYTNFDIIELFTQGLIMSKLGLDGFVSDIVYMGNEQVRGFGQNMAVANALHKDGVAIVENGGNEKGRTQYVIDADELSVGYIEETEEFFISMPKEQFEIELERGSIYTWMQQILIPSNCKEYFSNYSLTFITPAVAIEEYMMNYLPKEEWLVEGYPKGVEDIYKQKYPGGTPAVFCMRSESKEGYESWIKDIYFLFNLNLKDTYNNLKVVQRANRNGKRYVQFYGDGSTMLTILDIPAENTCMMLLTVGTPKEFEEAANLYSVNGETGILNKCIVSINQDGLNLRLKDPDSKESNKNSANFEFGLKNKFLE
ncbi:MAG: hypothetical protein IKY85_02855 [Bacteroidaceae bacterium]|nr:hypothetical protein [Bacteroidaceae bacterium]